MTKVKLTKPKRPAPYNRLNWPSPSAHAEAMDIYKQAMAIYIALGGE